MTFIAMFGFVWYGLEEKYMATPDHIWGPKQPTNQYGDDHCLDKWKTGNFSILNNFYIAIWHSIDTLSDVPEGIASILEATELWENFSCISEWPSHMRGREQQSHLLIGCPSWSQNSQLRLEILIRLGFSLQNPTFHFYRQKTPILKMKSVGFTVRSHMALIIIC